MYVDETRYAERFGQEELDQVTETNGGLTFATAAADADALIDSYLAAIPARTFLVPLTAPPARILGVAADLTRYNLWANRASDEIRRRRDEAVEYLKDLVAGRALLLLTDPELVVSAPAIAAGVGYRSSARTFTDETLAGFVGQSCVDDLGGIH